MSPKSDPDDTLRTEVVDDGATQLDSKTSADMMREEGRRYLAQPIQKERERLSLMGYSAGDVDALVEVYFSLRADHFLGDTEASRGVDLYLRARASGDNHEMALLKVVRCFELMRGGLSYEAACGQVFGISPGDQSSTVLVSDQNFGVAEAPQPVRVNGPASAPSPTADETLKVDARRRITRALELPEAGAQLQVAAQPSAPFSTPAAQMVAGSETVGKPDDGFRAARTLEKSAIELQVTGAAQLLQKERIPRNIALEGAELYRLLLDKELPITAMPKVRVYCSQRQLGASIADATKAAAGTGPLRPEHHPDYDPNLELAMRKGHEWTRTEIAAAIAFGVALTGLGALGLYEYASHRHHPAEGQMPVDGSGEVQPR